MKFFLAIKYVTRPVRIRCNNPQVPFRTKFYHHEYRIFKQLGRSFVNSHRNTRYHGSYLDRPILGQTKTRRLWAVSIITIQGLMLGYILGAPCEMLLQRNL